MSKSTFSIRFHIRQASHQVKYANLLEKGFRKHGYSNVEICINSPNTDHLADLTVLWSHKNLNLISKIKEANKDYLIMERAYIGDRHNWLSLGFNGLNGRADFCNSHITDLTRWNKHFRPYIKDWSDKSNDLPVLITGQVPGDASILGVDMYEWYTKNIQELQAAGHKILFRKHPLDNTSTLAQSLSGDSVKIDTSETLEEALTKVKACVTFNSNSGVISVLNGVSTVATDCGSMVYNTVSSPTINNLSFKPSRESWQAKIAYCQWLPEEIGQGIAWEHLKQKFNH
jgi:hypothetical protein